MLIDLLSKFLEERNFFGLRQELKNTTQELPEEKVLFYKIYCEQAFNGIPESNEYADILLKKYKNLFDKNTVKEILAVMSNNYLRSFCYEKASEIYNILLTQYRNELSEKEIIDYTNEFNLSKALRSVPPQRIIKNADVEIKSYRNHVNHIIVPVRSGGIDDEFIFDTGANFSVISQSYAEKMGLNILENVISVLGSGSNNKIQMKLGVANLIIGNLVCENVVFLISSDEDLTIPQANLTIHGLIGFPVIQQLGEIHINRDGRIFIPFAHEKRPYKNIFFNQLNPIVQLFSDRFSGKETLLLIFDTGANKTVLFKRYYDRHKEEIEKIGVLRTKRNAGAGGFIDNKVYVLKDFPYKIGNSENILSEISVLSDSTEIDEYYDGILGQDVILQHEKMILNFNDMFIDFQ